MIDRPLYGLLSYDTDNLGDEIQSLAARRFLPRVDHFIPREAIHLAPPGRGSMRLILNGWFMHRPGHWPPHERISPLLLSFHLSNLAPHPRRFWRRRPAAVLTSGRNLAWLRRNEPVGARDRETLAILQRKGVGSWLSACLTLTLPRPAVPRTDEVVACDLSPAMLEVLARRLGEAPSVATHRDDFTAGPAARLAKAEALLRLYAGARLVVTTRLHAALPCLAMGTPVLFVHDAWDAGRQAIGVALAHSVAAADFLADRWHHDLVNPPANPDAYRPFAEDLARRARAFVDRDA